VEKFTFGVAVVVMQGRTNRRDLMFAATDLTLGVLFVVAFLVKGGKGDKGSE
jgi:hypothetical protein